MKVSSTLAVIALTLITAISTIAQEPAKGVYVAPNAPPDKTVDVKSDEARRFEEAIKPYVEKAKSTYPSVKERFLKGLPPKHTFFITTRLTDASKRFEQVFIAVKEIKDGIVKGLIASDIQLVSGYKMGDVYAFRESELIDWTISKPDGTEEGNFVGNFLDTYQDQPAAATASAWRNNPATPERMSQRIEEAANKYAGDAPIPRVVLYDIGYPHNDVEYKALDGNAVMLLTVLAQERGDLPLKRVYVEFEGKEIDPCTVETSSLSTILRLQPVRTSFRFLPHGWALFAANGVPNEDSRSES